MFKENLLIKNIHLNVIDEYENTIHFNNKEKKHGHSTKNRVAMSYQSQAKGDKLCIILIILNYQLKIFKKYFLLQGYVNLSFQLMLPTKIFLKLQPNTKSNF